MGKFYVIDKPAHVTWYRYVVEADSEAEAIEKADEPDGYWDAEWTDAVPDPEAEGPKEYDDRDAALNDTYFEFSC